MSSPLNNNERYMVAFLRSDRAAGTRWGWLIADCLAAVIFAYGFFADEKSMTFTGFGILFLIALYSFTKQPQSTQLMISSVTKLEERIAELEAEKSK